MSQKQSVSVGQRALRQAPVVCPAPTIHTALLPHWLLLWQKPLHTSPPPIPGVAVGVGDAVAPGIGVDVGAGVGVATGVAVGVAVGVGVGFGPPMPPEGEALGVAVGLAEGVADGETVGVGDGVAPGIGVAVALGEGVAEGTTIVNTSRHSGTGLPSTARCLVGAVGATGPSRRNFNAVKSANVPNSKLTPATNINAQFFFKLSILINY